MVSRVPTSVITVSMSSSKVWLVVFNFVIIVGVYQVAKVWLAELPLSLL